jgi:hypothetical protein
MVSNIDTYQMIKIPGGEIELRDDRIKSKWIVKLKPFLLARFPVTRELFCIDDLGFRVARSI